MRYILILIFALSSQPAMAWKKLERENGCAFFGSFDGAGSTTIVVAQDKEDLEKDRIAFIVNNENWSISAGDDLTEPMGIIYGDKGFVGKAVALDHGFALSPSMALLSDFADSYPMSVEIKKGNAVIDRLNFDGFWSQFISFKACRRPWLEEKAEKRRLEDIEKNIPKDPFAKK